MTQARPTPTQPRSTERQRLTQRQRPTDAAREADRRANAIALSLGRDVRDGRHRLRLRQADLAESVGVHQTWISDIELGRGQGVPLSLWVAVGLAIGRPLAMSLTRPLGDTYGVVAAGHLEMQEALLALAATTGREGSVERASNPDDPRHATDVAIRDVAQRVLILAEAWNTFGDIGAAIRSTNRKQSEVRSERDAGRVATVWVVRATATNRAVVARYPNLFATEFDGSSRAWVRCLVHGEAPPERHGLVWFDPSSRRISEWRQRR